ncbi:MAG TPA: phosphatase PAP2 family protein [Nitrosarchaeum sp.]|nr:phosphatase PAP2 family protein [Nitrosarchaeum sp.]
MQNWLFDIRSRSFVLLVIGFVIVSVLVHFQITENFDQSIISFVADHVGNPSLDITMQIITESGDSFYLLGFGILMLLIKKTRRVGITLMILIVLSTLLTGYIKCGMDRDRPNFDYQGTPFPVKISRDTFALFCDGSYNASYPSGHAARTMIFAIVLGYAISQRFPRGAYLLFLYPILVSISRIYVLQHFPMDVIGGAILGVMLAGVLSKRTKLYKIFDKLKS